MIDAIAIPAIIIAVAAVIAGTVGIHKSRATSPLFNLAIVVIVGGVLCIGLVAILTLLSLLSNL